MNPGAVLLDVDGTLLDGERAFPGAAEAVARARARGLTVRFTTNTTRRPRAATAAALCDSGIAAHRDEVLIPASLARASIVGSGLRRAFALVPPQALEDFDGIEIVEERPDWVVVGDMGPGFTYDLLNRAFLHLRGGAKLLALHKNRFWHAGPVRGVVLDAGPFVAALEYATGITAEVVGKPSRRFFDLALADVGLPPDQVLVVGDDIVNDILGGAAAGCRTALVRTGRYEPGAAEAAGARPDLTLDSIADLLPD
ncbi:MAG: TIGR01458 family HAD-type hydrolase [Acidobacteria bacterium]|nr:TIGR01458 family HAD-type hydrolase [Acidobacteriota bacterium]